MIGSTPTLSASEFVAVFNQSVEMIYPSVRIVGELANFRVSRGRWVYFDLKDDFASVKFFGAVQQLPGPLEEGLILEVEGRPRLHPNFGFSVNIDEVKVSGEGSIRKAQDLLARKLTSEGLFDEARKRSLSFAPKRVGVISSKESAALADFRKIIDARWGNIEVQLVDVQVQGADSPKQIVEAVQLFNQLADPPEILVLIRGGGSADDLATYSTEPVVRAVAASRIPTLVAIGHETDVSLAELAADRRASTPSNAAELLVPDQKHEAAILTTQSKKLQTILQKIFKDEEAVLAAAKDQLDVLAKNSFVTFERYLERQTELLRLLDPKAPLKRGYALVWDNEKHHLRSAGQVKKGGVSIEFHDGMIKAKVEN